MIRMPFILRFNFAMDNLNELTLFKHERDPKIISEKIFANLTRFNIDSLKKVDFKLIPQKTFFKIEI